MTISEVSDQELSRWIAEKLEPEPEKINEHGDSRGGWWLWCYQHRLHGTEIVDTGKWQPRNVVNDPALTVKLIEHSGFVSLFLLEDGKEPCIYHAEFCGAVSHSLDCGENMRVASNPDPGRAIAEAFALANGWIENSIERLAREDPATAKWIAEDPDLADE